jgi:hypothetical protein
MKSTVIKVLLFLFMPFSIPAFSQNASENASSDKIECGIHDCTLNCLSNGKRSSSYDGARSITTEILPGGVVKYTIERGMNGRQVVLVGPNSYICSIDKD